MNTGENLTHARSRLGTNRATSFWAIRVRFTYGYRWRVYATVGIDEAITKAENMVGAIEATESHELTREQYETAVDRLKRGLVK